MPTVQPSGHVLHHASLDQFAGGQVAMPSQESSGPFIPSSELLQGAKTIGILHNGSLYRLQATKLGKLILTK